jgi:hypothetical protein
MLRVSRRWRDEVTEVLGLFYGARAYVDAARYGVQVPHLGAYWITALFAPNDWEPPYVYVSPEPQGTHHYYVHPDGTPRLCYTQYTEWSPAYRLATAVGCAQRFLNDFAAGGAR